MHDLAELFPSLCVFAERPTMSEAGPLHVDFHLIMTSLSSSFSMCPHKRNHCVRDRVYANCLPSAHDLANLFPTLFVLATRGPTFLEAEPMGTAFHPCMTSPSCFFLRRQRRNHIVRPPIMIIYYCMYPNKKRCNLLSARIIVNSLSNLQA